MTDTEGYNGWTNYPTWAVNLWLSNDEGMYNATNDLIASLAHPIEEPGYLRTVTDALQHWVVDELAPDLGASFAADLLGYALDQVDWQEIARAWIEV